MLNEAISKMTKTFKAELLLEGQSYLQRGQVLNIRLSEGLLKGRVKGNSSHLYDVHLDLKTWPDIPAVCTCPQHSNCKHAVACLFALQERSTLAGESNSAEKLDRKWDTWLKNLRIQEKVQQVEPTHQLVYLLKPQLHQSKHLVIIELALVRLLKRGGYGKKLIINSLSPSKKQHFLEEDHDIVAQLLYQSDRPDWFDRFKIRNSELLEKIINTHRAFWDEDSETPIEHSEPLNSVGQWILEPNGNQRFSLSPKGQALKPLLLDEAWFWDQEQGLIGRLNTPYTAKQISYLFQAPAVSLAQAKLLAQKMNKIGPQFPRPQEFEQTELVRITPLPILFLDVINQMEFEDFDDFEEDEPLEVLFVARVGFDYAGLLVYEQDECPMMVRQEGNSLLEYPRDQVFEAKQLAILEQHLPRSPLHLGIYFEERERFLGFQSLDTMDTLEDLDKLYAEILPEFKKQGWQIRFLSPLYQEIVYADEAQWYSELHEDRHDFFSYQLGILVEGQGVNIVPLVLRLLRDYRETDFDKLPDEDLIRLPLENSSKVLEIEMKRIKPLIRLLLQLGLSSLDQEKPLHLNPYQILLIRETELALAATKGRWRGSEALREDLKKLIQTTALPEILPPKGLNTNLRDYQHFGLSWLQFLRDKGFNGILADDMGLGKTVQTLAHLLYEKEQGRLKQPSLIIAPTSLVQNWLSEAKLFTPELKFLVYHGSDRHQEDFESYDVIVSTYGLIQRDKEKWVKQFFYYLILDEAQFIKNARTKTTQIIQQLKASHRLCLTGTPLENHLGELWSLFHFLIPGLLGDAKQFRHWFRTPIEKLSNQERRELLAKRVKPFMLRRTKNEVARELPPKTEMIRSIGLEGPQRDLYETVRMSMEKKVREAIAKQGLGKSHILLLDALLKLRQICCDPRLLSLPEATIAHGSSAKLETLMELLDNLVDEGRRVLVFSQFTSMLNLIEEALVLKKYPYLKLTGQTQNRQALVNQFQEGKTPIFLISLKAGGTGLNLTRADTVIHYDPWWNPAVEDQATDRTHRIGQEQPVFVYKLITSGTVEETILGLQARKRQLVDGVLSSDASRSLTLSEEDLAQFFMPLE